MENKPKIKHVIFDFDGTCTLVEDVYQGYLDDFLLNVNKSILIDPEVQNKTPITKNEWKEALEKVKKAPIWAGWTLATTPAAPAAADPYIHAHEAIKYIFRSSRRDYNF